MKALALTLVMLAGCYGAPPVDEVDAGEVAMDGGATDAGTAEVDAGVGVDGGGRVCCSLPRGVWACGNICLVDAGGDAG